MKYLAPVLIALLCATPSFSQVGIGTTEPTATLDIDGNIRVRKMNSSFTNSEAVKIVGLDHDGNFVEVEVDENIILENNMLRVVENRYRFANTTLISGNIIHNLNLIILPGEPNDDKKVMRIISTGDISLTGIEAGEDGQTIWLLPYNGKLRLLGMNAGSDPENQFMFTGLRQVLQYGMIQLLYDATLQKWLVMEY